MTTSVLSLMEFYDRYKNTVVGLSTELTDFSDGAMHDIIAGALSAGLNEVCELIISEFSKTYFELAGGANLDTLALDHFGTGFARPGASKATGVATFSRANSLAGDVLIAIGTIVKTAKDANGQEVRFATTEVKTLTGTTVNVNVQAVVAGVAGNAGIGRVLVLETTLTDPSVVVTNAATMAGGTAAPEDPEFRELIRSLIQALAGATEAAVKGASLSVAGVATASLETVERVVIDYDIGLVAIAPGATFFRIPYVRVYIADAAGNSSPALIQAVKDKLVFVRACGVKIEVLGATATILNWSAGLTLNPAGPNFTELQADLQMIEDSMADYINSEIEIGEAFVKTDANAYILAIWGPSGTDDLTAFSTVTPAGNVAGVAGQKLTAGTMEAN